MANILITSLFFYLSAFICLVASFFWLCCPSVCLSFLGKYFTLHMQNQKHISQILWTLRKHNFLSLALHIYSFRLKLLSPELECLYDRLFLSEPWVFQFLSFIQCLLCYLPFSRTCIHLPVRLTSRLFLLVLTGSLNSGLGRFCRTTSIFFMSDGYISHYSFFALLFLLWLTLAHSLTYSFSHSRDIYWVTAMYLSCARC